MCLIVFAHNTHPDYKLIVAANRDEFYGRPTRKAQFWKEEGFPHLLAGKDLEAGGTWMGVNKRGQWAALTNYRDPSWKRDDPPSRGALVLDYLKSQDSPEEYLKNTATAADQYMGYNILTGIPGELYHYSNKSDEITPVKPGIHGVSNALLDTSWPKLDRAKKDLERVISNQEFTPDDLFGLLINSELAPDDQLPDTGIPAEWEKAVSSVFIKTETYGTRCSTVLLIDKDDNITFIERRYAAASATVLETNQFELSSGNPDS